MAAEKRRADAQNRRVMDGERERNRQRKLNAQAGRDWDAEKNQDDFNSSRGGRGQYRRGAHGGVQYDGGRTNGRSNDYENGVPGGFEDNQRDSYRGRGQGRGRGRGGGRGRGRGDFNFSQGGRDGQQNNPRTPAINVESEFPALPPGTKPTSSDGARDEKKGTPKPVETPQPPAMATGTWADQVESSETPTRKQAATLKDKANDVGS
jgi:hypothetical protein